MKKKNLLMHYFLENKMLVRRKFFFLAGNGPLCYLKPESAPGRAQYDGRLGAKEGPVEGVGEFTNILDKVYRNI